jgi:hypothetical protein
VPRGAVMMGLMPAPKATVSKEAIPIAVLR